MLQLLLFIRILKFLLLLLLVVLAVFVLRRVDDVLATLQGPLVAQLYATVSSLDQGLHLQLLALQSLDQTFKRNATDL